MLIRQLLRLNTKIGAPYMTTSSCLHKQLLFFKLVSSIVSLRLRSYRKSMAHSLKLGDNRPASSLPFSNWIPNFCLQLGFEPLDIVSFVFSPTDVWDPSWITFWMHFHCFVGLNDMIIHMNWHKICSDLPYIF